MHYAKRAIEQLMINSGQGFDYSMCDGTPFRTLFQRNCCIGSSVLMQPGLQDL